LGGADHGREHQLHRGPLVHQSGDHFGAPAFFDEGALGQVRGAHPDAVAVGHAVDGEQRVEVVLEAGDRRGVVAAVGVDQPIGGGPRGVDRRRASRTAYTCAITSGAVSSGSLARMLASR
jgi:hypothetical protein